MPVAKLSFTESGAKGGAPIVFLHGFPLDRSMWDAQAQYLAKKGYRVIQPDLRGHGKSPVLDEASTMDRIVADVLHLCDTLNIKRFRLAGFSLGGYAALELVRRHPERVEALLLCDTRAEPDSEEGKQGRRDFIAKIKAKGNNALVEVMLPKLLTDRTRTQEPKLAERVSRMMMQMPTEGAIRALEGMMERPDQRPNLGTIKVPTLIVVGAEDKLTPPDAAMVLQKGIANSQLRIVTGAAHLVPIEQPEPLNHFLDHWVTGFHDKKPGLPWKEAA